MSCILSRNYPSLTDMARSLPELHQNALRHSTASCLGFILYTRDARSWQYAVLAFGHKITYTTEYRQVPPPNPHRSTTLRRAFRSGTKGVKVATTSAYNRDEHEGPATIIDFAPRSVLRRQVDLLITVAHGTGATTNQARRLVTDSTGVFGSEVVHELHRAVMRGPQHRAATAISLLLLIAGEPARAVLWSIARDEAFHPALRLDALRGLYQQGETVEIRELVALANACENDDD